MFISDRILRCGERQTHDLTADTYINQARGTTSCYNSSTTETDSTRYYRCCLLRALVLAGVRRTYLDKYFLIILRYEVGTCTSIYEVQEYLGFVYSYGILLYWCTAKHLG